MCLGTQAPIAKAQPQPDHPSSSRTSRRNSRNSNDDNLQTFKAQVNVVNLFFNVKDKHGMLIPNLTKD